MPELPEVEIIRRGLAKHLPGKRIAEAEVLRPSQILRPTPEAFAREIEGKVIESVRRRGKYLLLFLSEALVLVVHLRMTGRLVYVADGEVRDPYARVVFSFADGSALVFGDVRTFGRLALLPVGDLDTLRGLHELGPEPLTPEFSVMYLQKAVARHRVPIKTFLLDQRRVAGIGNIYADEALFRAGIHPARRADTLMAAECGRLHAAVNEVIAAGIADGGTTFRDYQNAEGGKGHHQEHLAVYEREGEACPRCGTPIMKMKLGGRGTRYCPKCQKL